MFVYCFSLAKAGCGRIGVTTNNKKDIRMGKEANRNGTMRISVKIDNQWFATSNYILMSKVKNTCVGIFKLKTVYIVTDTATVGGEEAQFAGLNKITKPHYIIQRARAEIHRV
ncbi:hypothetical protein HUJ04_003391 [Dendroctonus ponderosae]|nr:hypothetical protein HUJ04_003391 [Dendroctonus ponderosae]